MENPEKSPPSMSEETLQKLKWPAVSLIVAASVNAICSVFWLYGMTRLLLGGNAPGTEALTGDEKFGYLFGQIYSTIVAILTLALTPYIIKGAMKMQKAKQYNTARNAAILALVPLTSCCFVVGVPVGLWALSVLSKPEIKESFSD